MADLSPDTGNSLTDRPRQPVWQRRWFQWLMGLLIGLVVISFIASPILAVIYQVRSILAPVLIALGLAYVVNPAITYFNRRYRVPRWAGTAGILALGGVVLLILLLLILPPIVAQGAELVDKLKNTYPQKVVAWLQEAETQGSPPGSPATVVSEPLPPTESPGVETVAEQAGETIEAPAAQPGFLGGLAARARDPAQWRAVLQTLTERLRDLDWSQVSTVLAKSFDVGVGVVGTAIGFTTYLMLAAVVVIICFFYFAWKFDRITAWFGEFIPASKRAQTLDIIARMDQSISRFIRGRLIQAAVMGVLLSIGWFIAGVPYWLLLGVLSGFFNLVPFLAAVGWLVATVLTLIDHSAGGGPQGLTLWTLLGPTLVYMLAQGIDGWVVEPLVQGQATNLDPITVLLVVLIGAAVAGLLGMLLAIPVAACVKIIAKEVVLPKLRRLAAQN